MLFPSGIQLICCIKFISNFFTSCFILTSTLPKLVESFFKCKSFVYQSTKSYFYTFINKWDIVGHDSPPTSYQCDCIIVIIDEVPTSAPNPWALGIAVSHSYPNIQAFFSNGREKGVLPCGLACCHSQELPEISALFLEI